MLGLISDQTLLTINTIELVGIVYLAIALSRVHERVARMEGATEERRAAPRDHEHERGPRPP